MVYVERVARIMHCRCQRDEEKMRVILILWFVPLILFWTWYGLSAYDVNWGYFFLTRGFHDYIFAIYGKLLQMPPEDVPALIAGVFVFDSFIVLGIAALRWHKHWFPGLKQMFSKAFGRTSPSAHGDDAPSLLPGSVKVGPVSPAE